MKRKQFAFAVNEFLIIYHFLSDVNDSEPTETNVKNGFVPLSDWGHCQEANKVLNWAVKVWLLS